MKGVAVEHRRAISKARGVRRGSHDGGAYELWQEANKATSSRDERLALFRHLLHEAGLRGDPSRACSICGWKP